MTPLLNDNQVKKHLAQTPAWKLKGKSIVRTFEHKDFVKAIGFVISVGILAERSDHHPDIDIRWNLVTLKLSTHKVGGLTDKDFALARSIDSL